MSVWHESETPPPDEPTGSAYRLSVGTLVTFAPDASDMNPRRRAGWSAAIKLESGFYHFFGYGKSERLAIADTIRQLQTLVKEIDSL